MVILGLDPSFTCTGLSIWRSVDDNKSTRISFNKNEENFMLAMENAFSISKEVRKYIISLEEFSEGKLDEIIIAVEYPIMATRSGSYLSMITCKLDSLFRALRLKNVIYLPSVAIKAYTKTSNKTDLVQWFKKSGIVTKFIGNHDEASAFILGEIARKVHIGEYKKSAYIVDYSK